MRHRDRREEVSFTAETRSPGEGRIEWRGQVRGDVFEGTFTWHKEGKRPLEDWMRASGARARR